MEKQVVPATKPLPSQKQLEAAAMQKLVKMVKDDPGKKPSPEALKVAAKILALRAQKA